LTGIDCFFPHAFEAIADSCSWVARQPACLMSGRAL
jgi:hypothetical protein